MRRSSTIGINGGTSSSGGSGLHRTPSTGSGEIQNRRITMDALAGLRAVSNSDDPVAQLVEKERECDKLEDEVESLKLQLAARPPKSELDKLRQENKELENLIQAYQRENEKSLAKEKRTEVRERLLEQALEKAHGPSWAEILEIPCSPAPGHHQMSSFPSSRLNALPSSPSLSGSPSLQQHQSTPIRPSGTLSRNPSSTSTPTPLQNSFLPGSDSPSNSTDRGTPQQATTTTTPAAGLSWEDLEGVRNQVESLRMLIQGQERRLVRREGESVERIRRAEEESARWRGAGGELAAAV